MPPDAQPSGLSAFGGTSREFVRITAREERGCAIVEGAVAIPGLPVCRLRMRADAERLYRYEASRAALLLYVRAALCEDVLGELPLN